MASSQRSQFSEVSSKQEEEDLRHSEDILVRQILRLVFLDDKIAKLLPVLLLKYQKKDPITKAEILQIVDEDYHVYFPLIVSLIFILTTIFMKDNHASVEDIRKVLRIRERLPQSKYIVIEEPWKFITKDLVREQYLECRQVPNSDPARYEFLWGPRAQAETSKMKVLKHLAKVNRRDPRSYTCLYEKAMKDDLQDAMLE
nr:melanoma-associated antigen 10-like [Cavia porcellus]